MHLYLQSLWSILPLFVHSTPIKKIRTQNETACKIVLINDGKWTFIIIEKLPLNKYTQAGLHSITI